MARFGPQMPARLRPTAPIAEAAILVGDPGRALLLAQELLEQPKMSNHARGLWGYTGRTAAGEQLTVQSTGMGGPSAAIVLADLAELGVRRAVRVGTCTAVDPKLQLGELLVVTRALAHPFRGSFFTDSVQKEPRNREVAVEPDGGLTAGLQKELGGEAGAGTVVSLDALHRPEPGAHAPPGDVADMQTAALLGGAAELGVTGAAVLIVTETATGHLGDEELELAVKTAGVAAAGILSPSS